MKRKIGIVDYGAGNFASVWNAFKKISHDIAAVNSEIDIRSCHYLVLPGVGAFSNAMVKLNSIGISEVLKEEIKNGKPFLGICLGMQVLASYGNEFKREKGLDIVPGEIVEMDVQNYSIPLPHIGWNNLINPEESVLFKDIEKDDDFYFVHSYCYTPYDQSMKTVNFEYGGTFVGAFSIDNIHGVQFHPEKSQNAGLKLLHNFVKYGSQNA